jgi:hypothetical protein
LGSLLLLALALRLAAPSPDITIRSGAYSFFMDNAGFLAWGREISEATSLGIDGELLSAARNGGEQAIAEAVLSRPGNMTAALLYGLYDNPDRVTRLADVLTLSAWLRITGYSVVKAEVLMILISVASVALIYLLGWLVWRDRRIAALSALLMAIVPAGVESARWISWHVFGQFAFMLAIAAGLYAMAAFRDGGRLRYPLLAGVVWGISLYTNTLLPALVPLVLAPAVLFGGQGGSTAIRRAGLAYLGAGSVVFLPGLAFIAVRWSLYVERNLAGYAVDFVGRASVPEKLGAMLGYWLNAATPFLVLLSLVGIWASARSRRPTAYVPLAWLLTYVLFSLTLGAPHLHRRVGLTVLPALVLLAAAGLVGLSAAVARQRTVNLGRGALGGGVAVMALLLGIPTLEVLTTEWPQTEARTAIESVASRVVPGGVVVTNRGEGLKVLGPSLRTYTIISAPSLVRRSGEGARLASYLAWRYPGLRLPATHLLVLLDREEGPEIGADDAVVIGIASQSLLADDPGLESFNMERFGPGRSVYAFSP